MSSCRLHSRHVEGGDRHGKGIHCYSKPQRDMVCCDGLFWPAAQPVRQCLGLLLKELSPHLELLQACDSINLTV